MLLRTYTVLSYLLATLGVLATSLSPASAQFWGEKKKESVPTLQSVRMPEVPEHVEFAGEPVPLENFDVREGLERELMTNMFWHSQTFHIIKLCNRYFPMIEPILKKNNIPDDFKYLCVAESGLQHLTSPAKAVGFWQILEGTGKELGLEINSEIDERYHIEKSTEAACKFLLKSYEMFGSWSMAAASYNMGRGGLSRMALMQKSLSYYDLLLSQETTRYLFRIMALKLIIEEPEEYGFLVKETTLYPPYKYFTVEVKGSIESWTDFAERYQTNYKILKRLNPWLRQPHLENKAKKTYQVKIPEPGYREGAYK